MTANDDDDDVSLAQQAVNSGLSEDEARTSTKAELRAWLYNKQHMINKQEQPQQHQHQQEPQQQQQQQQPRPPLTRQQSINQQEVKSHVYTTRIAAIDLPAILKSKEGITRIVNESIRVGELLSDLEHESSYLYDALQDDCWDTDDVNDIYTDMGRIDEQYEHISRWLIESRVCINELVMRRTSKLENFGGENTSLGKKIHMRNQKLLIVLQVFDIQLKKINNRKRK